MPSPTNVTLYIAAPFGTASFDPSIEGVDPITASGTVVPASAVKAVKASARQHGILVSQRS